MLNAEALALPLNEFGIAVVGNLLQIRNLTKDLDAMLVRVQETAATTRAAVSAPEWDLLVEQADALHAERRWTGADLDRLAEAGDPRADVLMAPIARMLVEGTAMMRETNAALFPRLLWSSVVVTVLSEWEVALRVYPEYLSHRVGVAGLASPNAAGKTLMTEFKAFCKGPLGLGVDFSTQHWKQMNAHREVRNLIVHWGGRVEGRSAKAARETVDSFGDLIVRHGNLFTCTRGYAETVASDALGFLGGLDVTLRAHFPTF